MENNLITILVLDDEPAIVSLITDILTARGYHIIGVTNSSEAVEQFQFHQEKISLVILDMNMAGSSGLDVFNEMKKIKPSLRALLVTGSGQQNLVSAALVEGIDDYLQKPFRMQELLHKVRSLIEKDQAKSKQ